MKKLNSVKFRFVFVVATIAIFTLLESCKRDLEQINPKAIQKTQPSKTSELTVSENFNWETNYNVEFEITPSTSGLLLIQGENAELFHKAFVKAGISYHPTFTVQNKYSKMIVFLNGKQEKFNLSSGIKIKSNLK